MSWPTAVHTQWILSLPFMKGLQKANDKCEKSFKTFQNTGKQKMKILDFARRPTELINEKLL